jgi:hypothetical protein
MKVEIVRGALTIAEKAMKKPHVAVKLAIGA